MEIKVILMSNFTCKLLRKGLNFTGASKYGLQEQEYIITDSNKSVS